MKVTVQKPVEIDVRYLRVVLPVAGEEWVPYDATHLGIHDGVFDITIDVDAGVIRDWQCPARIIEFTNATNGTYYLLNSKNEVVATLENSSVPNNLFPDGFGSSLYMHISEDGTIQDWFEPEFDDFTFVVDPNHRQPSNDVLSRGITAVASLIDESEGVAGLHLNGDLAPWSELRTGGRFEEWLVDFDAALRLCLEYEKNS